MKSFKSFIKESTDMNFVRQQDKAKFDSAIEPYTYTVKNSTNRKTVIIVRSQKNDRQRVKQDIETKLGKANIGYELSTSGGSTGSTLVKLGSHTVQVTYKPVSGGMSETTLNSTITELVPSLAFMSKKSFDTVDQLYDFVSSLTGNEYGVYVNVRDQESGKQFIETMPSSSKYVEKMENALGILNYLNELNKEAPISQVYWGYRAKPEGIPASHKGDLFVKFKNGNMLGVSLKAGGEKTSEPQLNTYVNKFFDDFGYAREKQLLQFNIFNSIHSKIGGLTRTWEARSTKQKSLKIISEFQKKKPKEYDALYDEMLEMVRESLIRAARKDMKKTMDYIQKQILKKDKNVPLVVIKAFGTNYKKVTDEDDLETFMPKVKNMRVYASQSSKQDWFIELSSGPRGGGDSVTLKMSVRSNKSPPENKVAQGFNLAIKFNGIK